MAVTVIDERTLTTVTTQTIFVKDPFALATPCWLARVAWQLPPQFINTLDRKVERMPIKVVEAASAPKRLFVRGGISSKQDYVDLLQAVNSGKPNQAFIVDMDPSAWVKDDGKPMDKPEVTFANSLRRRFDAAGLTITAYMSGKHQITVRRLTELELKERNAGKGKRKKSK